MKGCHWMQVFCSKIFPCERSSPLSVSARSARERTKEKNLPKKSCTDPSYLSIRAVWESGAIRAKRGARLLNRLLKRALVHKSEVGYERILKIS